MINVKFLLTNVCNFRCRFCHNEFQPNKRVGKFDLDKVGKLIDEHLTKFNNQPLNFKFSGGEPTLEMNTFLGLLDFSRKYNAKERILISNLSLLKETDIKLLVEKGINEVRVNIPSFDSDKFKYYTEYSIDDTLEAMQLFKNFGCVVRINSVISEMINKEHIIAHMFEMINKSKEYKYIDEIYFIADYYSDEKIIYNIASEYLKGIDSSFTVRRNRIFCGKSDNLLIYVSRCLDRRNYEEDETEIYIIPDGKILKEYNFRRRNYD